MKKSSIKANALLNTIKQSLTILFPLITFPYISRVLETDYFGKYNFSMSIVSYFSMLATLGIPTYAVREGSKILGKDEKKAQIFFNEVYSINICSMVFSYLILALCVTAFPVLSDSKGLILIQSLSILFATISADWINTIFEDFKYLTIRYAVVQAVSLILMFAFVKKPQDYIDYAWITVFASSVAGFLNVGYIRKYTHLKITGHLNLKQHFKPVMILFVNLIAVSLYINSDVTMLGIFRTEKEVGIYSASVKIYNLAKQLINATSTVVIPRVAFYIGRKEKEKYKDILNNTMKYVLFLGVPAFMGMFIMAHDILELVSGSSYVEGVGVLRILAVSMIFAVVSCFFVNVILIPNNKESLAAKATIISAIVNISLNFITIPLMGIEGAALTTLIAETIVMVVAGYSSRTLWKYEIHFSFMVKIFVGAILMTAIVLNLSNAIESLFIRTVAVIVSSVVFYVIFETMMKNDIAISLLKPCLKRITPGGGKCR